jgi:RNA polymerase sigma factor (sigma-70 family)
MRPERDPLQEAAAESLAVRFAASDPAAVDHARAIVRGIVRHRGYLIPADERNEAVQDVLTRVARALSRGEVHGRFEAFLRRTAHQRCVEWLRSLRTERSAGPSFPEQDDSPHDALGLEERRRVCDAIAELRGAHREVVGLRFGLGMPYAEMAALVGRTEDVLRAQAIESLRQVCAFLAKPAPKEGAS